MDLRQALAAATLALTCADAAAEEEARRIARHGDWAVFRHYDGESVVCWAATTPFEQPERFAGGQTTIIMQGHSSEFSVIAAGGDFAALNGWLLVGFDSFDMVFRGGNGWSRSPDLDLRIEAALASAPRAAIEVAAERFVFSTNGFAAALEDARTLCGMV